ncbi:MAG: hypothetical protein P8P74_04425 [Crocinitomicaceae bacterium]|nr:hypothetical protein [Crocinitomicaceae bacterium]
MKRKFIPIRSTYLLCCVFVLSIGIQTKANASSFLPNYNPDPIEVNLSTEWQEYSNTEGVLIEYKMEEMNSPDYGREVNMVIFRFTNTTNQSKDCSWIVKIERGNDCYNCDGLIKPENTFRLTLEPQETIEGDVSNLISHSQLNIFGNFVKLVPGMSEEVLTGFELINLTVK